jgi:hypothetical protein
MERRRLEDKVMGMALLAALGEQWGLEHARAGALGGVAAHPERDVRIPSVADVIALDLPVGAESRRRLPGQDLQRRGVPGPFAEARHLRAEPFHRCRRMTEDLGQTSCIDGVDLDVLLMEACAAQIGRPRLDLAREVARRASCVAPQDRWALGLWTALIAEALAAENIGKHAHYWLSELLRSWLPEWASLAEDSQEGDAWRCVRSEIQDMIALGINLRGRPRSAYFAAALAEHEKAGGEAMGTLAIVKSIATTMTYAGAAFLEALRLLGRAPGRPPAAGNLAGLFIGAFYGEAKLRAFEREAPELESAFDVVAAGERDFLNAGAAVYARAVASRALADE